MAFNIMDLFNGKAQQAAPATPAPVTPPNTDVPGFQGTAASPKDNTQAQVSPLDEFTKLLHNAPIKDGDPQPMQAPKINLDVAKLQETVGTMDFGIQVSPEDFAKIQQGDVTTFTQLLNKVSQAAFLRSAIANSSVVDQMTSGTINYLQAQAPTMVRQEGIISELRKDPTLSHEATAGFTQQLALQIAKNMPTASPQEVAEKTVSFLKILGGGNQPQPQASISNGFGQQQQMDWDNFFKS